VDWQANFASIPGQSPAGGIRSEFRRRASYVHALLTVDRFTSHNPRG
jgi:hypothetical protein